MSHLAIIYLCKPKKNEAKQRERVTVFQHQGFYHNGCSLFVRASLLSYKLYAYKQSFIY